MEVYYSRYFFKKKKYIYKNLLLQIKNNLFHQNKNLNLFLIVDILNNQINLHNNKNPSKHNNFFLKKKIHVS